MAIYQTCELSTNPDQEQIQKSIWLSRFTSNCCGMKKEFERGRKSCKLLNHLRRTENSVLQFIVKTLEVPKEFMTAGLNK